MPEETIIKTAIKDMRRILKLRTVETIFPHYIARIAKELGFLDDVAYRNICIKIEYEQLRLKGFRVFDCKEYLAKKYVISEDSIHSILYRS